LANQRNWRRVFISQSTDGVAEYLIELIQLLSPAFALRSKISPKAPTLSLETVPVQESIQAQQGTAGCEESGQGHNRPVTATIWCHPVQQAAAGDTRSQLASRGEHVRLQPE
jgi:hypothetical protein